MEFLAELLETLMIIGFGVSWPLSIYKSYTSKSTKGKSILFLFCIAIGYVCGIIYKLISKNLNLAFWFYIPNVLMVSTDIIFKQDNNYKVIQAKSVILATGGSGSLLYNNMQTSNCRGSTADGLAIAIAYHAGAKLIDPGAIQYHPTGGAYPINLCGKLISEKARSLGALLFNAKGEALQSKGNRDDIVSMILSEEAKGNAITTPDGNRGIWLATPLIEKISGVGTIEKKLPALLKKYQLEHIDIRKHAILIYPTIHYHLGGIEIDPKGMSTIPNLFAVGEVSGGIDGDNRLMGNALASVVVYGRTAGRESAEIAKKKDFSKKLSLDFLLENNFLVSNDLTR